MDEYFVTSRNELFGRGDALSRRVTQLHEQIQAAVYLTKEDEVVAADIAKWASGLAQEHKIEAPHIDREAAELREAGPVMVDCTNVPGITYTSMELGGPVLRPGVRFVLRVPGCGELDLLRSRLSAGGPSVRAELEHKYVVRTWDWPEVKGPESFNAEVEHFLMMLGNGVEAIARQVAKENNRLIRIALTAIDTRRDEILRRREFLGALKMPVKRADDAPKTFGPPPIKARPRPAQPASKSHVTEDQPALDDLYHHILEIIHSSARAMERSPGSFAAASEETLRDHMLTTLNTHYTGQTYAEAFNRSGKTDILIRIHDRNAFIGECKWWSGKSGLNSALDQLFGYTTWRDSRLALIFYVKAQSISGVIDTARTTLAERGEFIQWENTSERELRCRVRWPDDDDRQATLAVVFAHILGAKDGN